MIKYLDYVENKLDILWKRAAFSSDNDTKSLSFLRIFYSLFIILFSTPSFSWIGKAPQALFSPPLLSLSNIFDSFPGYLWFLGIDVLLIILVTCMLLGVKARYAGVLFSILYVVGFSFKASFGKIDHGIMLPIFVLGLSFTNWGTVNALIPDKKVSLGVQRKVLAILAFLLCFGMFTAGFEKALNWVDFDLETGGFLAWFYRGFFNYGRNYFLAPIVLSVPPQFFEVFDYLAVILELSPLIALLAGRKWWHLWLLTAATFHLGNLLLLNISFINHVPVYLSFIPVGTFFQGYRFKFQKQKIRLFVYTLVATIIAHYSWQLYANQSISSVSAYALPLVKNERLLKLYLSLLMWTISIVLIGISVRKLFLSRKDIESKNYSYIQANEK